MSRPLQTTFYRHQAITVPVPGIGTGGVSPAQAGLTWPNDPVVLGTPGWSLVSDFDCATFAAKVNEPGTPFDTWTVDTEFGDPTTSVPATLSIVTDASSPTGKSVYRYFAQGGVAGCGNGVGPVWYRFSTPPRKVYWGAYYKLSNPTASNMDNWHAMYFNFAPSGDIILDLQPNGGFELFSDQFSDNAGFYSLGQWFQIELIVDCVAQKCSLWCSGTPVTFSSGSINFGGHTTIDHLQADSTVHCSSGTTANADSSLYLAHNRLSVFT